MSRIKVSSVITIERADGTTWTVGDETIVKTAGDNPLFWGEVVGGALDSLGTVLADTTTDYFGAREVAR